MDFIWHIIAITCMTIPHALAYNLVFGKGKILHFGPIGVSLVASYAVVIIAISTGSFIAATLVGLISVVLLSLFLAWLSLRLDQDAFGVMTIAVHLSILAVILNWNGLTRGALGIPGVPRFSFLSSVQSFAIAAAVVSLLFVIALRLIDRSSFGRQLQALAEHEWHAKSLGINRTKVHVIAFLVAGLGALATALLFPQYLAFLHPNDYQYPFLVFFITIIVAGNPGSVYGVLLSTILLTVLKEALRFLPLSSAVMGPVRLILFGIIMLAVVHWRRDTLFPKQRSI